MKSSQGEKPLFRRPNDVARLFNMNEDRVRRLVHNGVLKARRDGRSIFISTESIEEYVRNAK